MHGIKPHSENMKGKDDLGELNADGLNRLHLLFPPCLPHITNNASLIHSFLLKESCNLERSENTNYLTYVLYIYRVYVLTFLRNTGAS